MNKMKYIVILAGGLTLAGTASGGMLDAIKTIKQAGEAKDMYDSVQTVRTVQGMENAAPIYTGAKYIYVKADLKPAQGDAGKMNQLVEKVLCDNVKRIVDNLDDYDLEGATPKCKAGLPEKESKKKIVILSVSQKPDGTGINIESKNSDPATGETLKTLSVDGVANYLLAVEKIVDDVHGDLVLSSRTNNPISTKKWPKRFRKYSEKKKHRVVSMKRKERKQLEKNAAS